jgi:hypothetical protein
MASALTRVVARAHLSRWWSTVRAWSEADRLSSTAARAARSLALQRAVRQWRWSTRQSIASAVRIAQLHMAAVRFRQAHLFAAFWRRWALSFRASAIITANVRQADAVADHRRLRRAWDGWTGRTSAKLTAARKWRALRTGLVRAAAAEAHVAGRLRRFTDPNRTDLPLLSTLTVWMAPPLRMLFRRWRDWAQSQAFARHADRFRAWQQLRLNFRAWHKFVRTSADSVSAQYLSHRCSPGLLCVPQIACAVLTVCSPHVHCDGFLFFGVVCSWPRASVCWTLRAATLN